MSVRSELFEAYQQWRKLSVAEGEAIQNSDWTQVSACQGEKKQLQSTITRLTAASQYECAAHGNDLNELQTAVRAVIADLIIMESRNGEILAAKRQTVEAKRIDLRSTRLNLNRVRNSYGNASVARHRLEEAV